jgi:hypothetical protein
MDHSEIVVAAKKTILMLTAKVRRRCEQEICKVKEGTKKVMAGKEASRSNIFRQRRKCLTALPAKNENYL